MARKTRRSGSSNKQFKGVLGCAGDIAARNPFDSLPGLGKKKRRGAKPRYRRRIRTKRARYRTIP